MTVVIGGGLVLDVAGVQDMPVGGFLSPATLGGPLQTVCHLAHQLGDTVMYAGIALFLLVALRTLVRQPWLGNALWVVAFAALMTSGEIDSILDAIGPLILLLVFLALLTRFGFLAVVAFLLAASSTSVLPVTLQPDDSAFASGVLSLLVFTGLVTWAYRAAVGGRSAFA